MRLLFIATCVSLCHAASSAFGQRPTPIALWEFNSPSDAPFCQINGKASEGEVILFAGTENYFDKKAKIRRDVVDLILRKPTWRIPAGTAITATMAFSDGTSMKLIGTGQETDVQFYLTETTLKPWLHGFTSGKTATITFGSGNEPIWRLELQGTTPAVSAMYNCVQSNQLALPPPLGTPRTATQPF